ncbi:MAG TPA: hypothetical protein VLA24_09505, partial [Pseudomonadales bacterium]|nr:hypothetical protein [Pseudomonadales bacterium]
VRKCLPMALYAVSLPDNCDLEGLRKFFSGGVFTMAKWMILHDMSNSLCRPTYSPLQAFAKNVALNLYDAGNNLGFFDCSDEYLCTAAVNVCVAYAMCLDTCVSASDKEAWIMQNMMPVLDQLLAIGNKTPIELSCDERELNCAVQRV